MEGRSEVNDDHNGKRSDNGSEHVNTALENSHTNSTQQL